MGYIEGESIGEAYFKALDAIVNTKIPYWYLTIHISQPILVTSTGRSISSLDINKLLNVINVGNKVYDAFTNFKFPKQNGWTKGSSGMDWINGRIKDLLDDNGYYNYSLSKGFQFNQLQEIEKRLSDRSKKGNKMHGGSTNALVCTVFLPNDDLIKACKHRPNAKGMRCLTQIDFKPIKDKLNLMAVFRSQFFDTKAYGNFIALAILLYKICQNTGYKPGAIVSTANKVTFDDPKKPPPLYEYLSASIGGDI